MEIENTSFEKELFNDYEREKLISLNLIKYSEYADYLSSYFFQVKDMKKISHSLFS